MRLAGILSGLITGILGLLLGSLLDPNKLSSLSRISRLDMYVSAALFLITLGLYLATVYAYDRLLVPTRFWAEKTAKKDMHVYGQFRLRPDPVLGRIDAELAARVIYPSVLAAWTFLAFRTYLHSFRASLIALGVLIVFLIGSGQLELEVDIEELRRKIEREDQNKAPDDTDSGSLGTNPV